MKKFKFLDILGPFSGIEHRRSTRVERSVPLVISGQNNHGQPFQERTWTISFNLHGCRYPSRHDCGIGTWISVQAGEPGSTAKIAATRAQVKSIHARNSARESYQIGIELETPGNIWEIFSPPEDWLRAPGPGVASAQSATAAAPERDPMMTKMSVLSRQGLRKPEHWPVLSTPSQTGAPNRLDAAMESDPPKPTRIVVSPDELVASLEGKLQLAADKAVQSALATHLEPAVKKSISTIDEVCQANARRLEDSTAQHLEALLCSSRDEVLDRMESLQGEAQSQWTGQIEKYTGQVEETARGLEKLAGAARHDATKAQELMESSALEIERKLSARLSQAVARAAEEFEGAAARASDRQLVRLVEDIRAITREAAFQVEARAAEARSILETAARSALDEFRHRAEVQAGLMVSETKQRVASSLASLDAENRTVIEARIRALQSEVARTGEQFTEQFRHGLKAFFYSCLVAAVSAIEQHSKTTFDGLTQESENPPPQISPVHQSAADPPNLNEWSPYWTSEKSK